jgi:deazaflavin-dependent oxidoreductase (nitroreductase family)
MPDPSSQDARKHRDASPGQRAIRRLSALRLVSWVMAGVLPRLDQQVGRLTRGRHTLTSLLSGLTVAQLTTTGTRSGRPQMVRLLGFPADDGFVVIASNYGKARHPGWYYNLLAQPRADLVVGGRPRMVVAELTTGQARAQLWERALAYYPGWQNYQRRHQDRQIGVFLLRDP